jgi:hypothetical protein
MSTTVYKDPQMTCTHGSWNTTDLFTQNNWRILASKAWRISLHTVDRLNTLLAPL